MELAEAQDGFELERRDIAQCFSCPVKIIEDAVQEAFAEALCS